MGNVAQQLRLLNLYVNTPTPTADAPSGGNSYAGVVEEFRPGSLQIMTAEHHPGGFDMPVTLDMGMETPVCTIIVNGYFGQILEQFGLADADAVIWEVRGALEDFNGNVKNITFKMNGTVYNMPLGRLRGRGEVTKCGVQVSCTVFEVYIAGTEHIYVDAKNAIRRIGGVDRMAKLREAVGLAA